MKKLLFSTILVLWTALTFSSIYSQTIGHSDIQPKPTISIWPGKAPGSEDWTFSERVTEGPGGSKTYSNVVNPTLTVYLPDPAKANGAAVILCPGGAMRMLGFAETERTAEWLNSKGISAFILKYRVVPDTPSDGWRRAACRPFPVGISGDGE